MASASTEETNILDLPPELIGQIFQYLNLSDLKSVSLACKLFYEISRSTKKFLSKSILTFIDINDINLFIQNRNNNNNNSRSSYPNIHLYKINLNEINNFLHEYGNYIEQITFNHIDINSLENFIYILKQMKNLKSINLYQCKIKYENNNNNIENNDKKDNYNTITNVNSLTVGSHCKESDIKFFSKILKNLTNSLKIISIDYGQQFPLNINEIINIDNNLNELHLQSNYQLTDLNKFLPINLIYNLKTLALRNFILMNFDQFLRNLTENLNNLICLDLSDCHNITEYAILQISKKCPNLKAISLNNLHYLDDICVIEFVKLKNLQIFHATCCCSLTNSALIDGIAKYKNLNMEVLNLSKIKQIDEDAIIQCVTNFPNLKQLNVNNCKAAVTNRTLQIILKNLKMLQLLDIGFCNVSGEGFVEYEFPEDNNEKLPLNHLSDSMTNSHTTLTTDRINLEIKYLLNDLKGLHVLNLQACNISNYLVINQIKLLELKELNLNECNRIFESGFKSIGMNCPSIENLSIIGCKKLNGNQCANVILEHFKRLKKIYTCKCNSPKSIFEANNCNILKNLLVMELYCESCRFCYLDRT